MSDTLIDLIARYLRRILRGNVPGQCETMVLLSLVMGAARK